MIHILKPFKITRDRRDLYAVDAIVNIFNVPEKFAIRPRTPFDVNEINTFVAQYRRRIILNLWIVVIDFAWLSREKIQ